MQESIRLVGTLLVLLCPPWVSASLAQPAAGEGRAGWPSSNAAQQPLPPSPTTEGRVEQPPEPWMKGRFLVGAALRVHATPDADLGSTWRLSAVVSYRPRPGWGPAFSLSWFRSDIVAPVGGVPTVIGSVRVRPVMGGVGYGFLRGKLLTTFKATAGYAFNRADVAEGLAPDTTVDMHIERAWAAHPSVNVVYPFTSRLAFVGSMGYVFTNPSITIDVVEAGGDVRRLAGRWATHYLTAGVGVAVSIF